MGILHNARLVAGSVRYRWPKVQFSDEELARAQLGAGLPQRFLLGAATSSHQVEGNNDNDWTEFEKGVHQDGTPHIKDGTPSGVGPDSWNRFEEDLAALKRLGANSYRFSVEWSRIQPAPDRWDDAALDRYARWCEQLRQSGIEPMVTLLHFTLPRWIAAEGGWESDRTAEHFAVFARRVAGRLGHLVDWWCTVNEPSAAAFLGYVQGIWAPGKKDMQLSAEVYARMFDGHARAAAAIREVDTTDADGDGKPALVGIAHHLRIIQPAMDTALDRMVTAIAHDFVNESAARAIQTGRVIVSIPGVADVDVPVPGLKGSMDYFGFNYYSRDHVAFDRASPSRTRNFVPEGKPTSDLGWEIFPEGLYLLLKRYAGLGLPMVVTENGIDDRTGARRPGFLRAHFYAVQKAISEGVDVRGYYHWSLIDNFEWAEGYHPRFGLFRVDALGEDKRRQETPAVAEFRRIADRMRGKS